MAVKGDTNSEKKWRSLLVLVFITLAAGVVTYFLMPIFLPADQNDVQIISAPDGPIKVKPDDVGGKAIKNQDSAVMSMIANNSKSDVDVENLRPLSSDPELPPVTLTEETKEAEAEPDTQIETDNETTMEVAAANVKPSDTEETSPPLTSDNETVSNESPEAEKAPKSLIPKAKPAGKPQKPAITRQTKTPKTDEPLYRVQLAAFRNDDKAAEVASLLTQKHRTRLNDVILETTKIETKDNGVFWRIVTEALVRVEADNLCTLLKRAGQDCILRKVKTAGQ
ncbi:SPOR domain-containing protein [Candidatus Puniceispirillum marinum]|uniref:Periplasmic protein TonB, links inner and outer membranes n=1 Tax=Puniceispirillum marinum (strain IMCC1322) TaxID=488538 RepID=D5BQU9_PUNMI|nr:SPOR domain-containing protein [Candidatus Puniceispirillum marinum]ADE38663.1 Periplasmic protein TonB, links inner and outer membranes [Candidatus Puniceispirillum marinum IMCC1322]